MSRQTFAVDKAAGGVEGCLSGDPEKSSKGWVRSWSTGLTDLFKGRGKLDDELHTALEVEKKTCDYYIYTQTKEPYS